jgi:hypothetical protein
MSEDPRWLASGRARLLVRLVDRPSRIDDQPARPNV